MIRDLLGICNEASTYERSCCTRFRSVSESLHRVPSQKLGSQKAA